MKSRILVSFCIFIFLIGNLNGQTAKQISENAMEVIEFESMEMKATLKILDAKGRERTRQLTTQTKSFGEITKTLIKFNAPAEVRGTSMLIFDNDSHPDDMWIYLPALRKTRRIVSSEKGKSFMGSEFTNADMSLPNADDYIYEILGEEELDNILCWKIKTSCRDEDIEDENGFKYKLSWIDKALFLCYKIEFYDGDDELSKVQGIQEYKKQENGLFFAFYMEMENVQNGRRSIMTVDNFQLGSDLSESLFSPARLVN